MTWWKIMHKEKDKNQRKRQTRWKRMGIITESTISKVFYPMATQAFISTDSLAVFYEICFLFNTCPKLLHSPCISVSQSEKIIFRNTWLINVLSWNSGDINFSFEFTAHQGVPQITIHGWSSFILLLLDTNK